MRAEYDSRAKALGITLVDHVDPRARHGDEVGPGCVVAVDERRQAVDVELLDPEANLASLRIARSASASTTKRWSPPPVRR